MITYAPRDHNRAIKARRFRLQNEHSKRTRRFISVITTCFILAAFSIAGYLVFGKPLPSIQPVALQSSLAAQSVSLTWPSVGQAAIGEPAGKVLAETSVQISVPTASTAKIMTALMVLKKHPLQVGEQGEVITITQHDVDIFNQYASIGGSTTPVTVGEKLTEYQALQALLLPSANNIADSLAAWSYSSMEAYLQVSNAYAQQLGMKQTTFAVDASGFSPATVSTAHDLVLLGQAALKQPVIAAITAQQIAEVPVAGPIKNVNSLLGTDGIIGLKTGNTEQAGGCFLFAATRTIEGHAVTLVGAIMGTPNLGQALADSRPLLSSGFAGFGNWQIAKKGAALAYYQAPWGAIAEAQATSDVNVFGWQGQVPDVSIKVAALKATEMNLSAGTLTATSLVDSQASPLKLNRSLTKPSLSWRLKHAL